jgi:hypothetical protein
VIVIASSRSSYKIIETFNPKYSDEIKSEYGKQAFTFAACLYLFTMKETIKENDGNYDQTKHDAKYFEELEKQNVPFSRYINRIIPTHFMSLVMVSRTFTLGKYIEEKVINGGWYSFFTDEDIDALPLDRLINRTQNLCKYSGLDINTFNYVEFMKMIKRKPSVDQVFAINSAVTTRGLVPAWVNSTRI